MHDVHPLENLVNLDYLALMDNEITTLGGEPFCGSWGIMANAGIGAGDTVYVDGNPLTVWAICGEIRELRDRGVYVSPDIVCDDDPQSTGDWDGDTFTNAEELRFIQYFYNDPETVNDLFLWYIMFDNLPAVTRDCYENVDKANITVSVGGGGTVWVGDGAAFDGELEAPPVNGAKMWEFALWSMDNPCRDPTDPIVHNTTVSFVAVPDEDWVFHRWIGPFGEIFSPELPLEDAMFGSWGDTGAKAEFLYRPGIADLGFIADLDTFLLAIGYITESMAPELFEYDTGETEWVPDGQDGSTLELRPNGIPDAVELLVLQYVLQDVQYNRIPSGGASHIHTWRSWERNLATAQSQINNPQLDYLSRLVAAYMTIGTPGHRQTITKLLDDFYAVTLDPSVYDTSVTTWFNEHGDPDADGVWNIEEWENVEEALEGTVTPEELVEETAESATDPEDSYTPPPPAPGTFEYNDNVIQEGSAEHQALIAQATGANGPLAKGTITFMNNSPVTIEAVVIDPPGFDSVPMPVGAAITCALGRKFRVSAKGDTRWFDTWAAEHTLIHGSAAPTETFTFGASTQVQPGKRLESTVTIGDHVEWSGVGPLWDEIWTSQDYLGRTVLHVAEGTYVRVILGESAPPTGTCLVPGSTLSWKLNVDGQDTYRECLTVRGGHACTVERVPLCSRPTWTHELPGDGGVSVFGLQGESGDIHGYIPNAITDVGPWPDDETFDDTFVAELVVQPGYQVETVSLPGMGTQCAFGLEYTAQCNLTTGPGGIAASSEKRSTLTVIPELVGDSEGSVAEAGYFTGRVKPDLQWSSLRKYFTRLTDCHTSTQLIELTAVPHDGYFFARWKGDGEYFIDEQKTPGTGALDASDDDGNNWATESTIYIECREDRTLKPVFHPCIHCGTVHDGRLRGSTLLPAGDGYALGGEGNYYACLHHVIRKIQRIGAAWNEAYPNRNFTIQRISPAECEDPGEGTSHHNGLDVDVWYVQTPGRGRVYLNPYPQSTPNYDQAASQALINLFVDEQPTLFVFDNIGQEGSHVSGLNPGGIPVDHVINHHHHFHVRFADPDIGPENTQLCPTCPP